MRFAVQMAARSALLYHERCWLLPRGTMDELLQSLAGVRDAEWVLLDHASILLPTRLVDWLHRSRDPRLRRAGDLLEARLGGLRSGIG